jgi:acylphosphatase
MSQLAVRRFVVSGKVQGVFYRASTREKALSLGLCGYAKNLADGTVEVLAAGDMTKISELEHWLWHGPPTARVNTVLEAAARLDEAGRYSTFVTM